MKKYIPYGYNYDEKKKQLIIDEREAKNVRKVFNLYDFNFDIEEITYLMSDVPLEEVISIKITKVIREAQQYDETIGNNLINDKLDIEEIIKDRNNINENIIKVLDEDKKKVEKVDSSTKEDLLENIGQIINILNHLEEIADICKQ